MLIEFLQANPYYFRSGYLKADVLRWLGRIPLDQPQMDRLRTIVLEAVTGGWRREFRRYCAFAKRLDSPAFRRDLGTLAASTNGDVSKRAKRVLNALDGIPSIWHEWQARQRMSAEEQAAAFARLNAKTIQSIVEHVRRYRHQMDLREARAQLELIARLGSAEAKALLQELEALRSGDAAT